jgi:hypothetical protein
MQSNVDYVNIISNGVVIKCKEVNFPDKLYSKLVTSDGRVSVLYSPEYGSGWSTRAYKIAIKHQLTFDSKIVLHVLSPEFKIWSSHKITADIEQKYKEFIKSVVPDIEDIDIPHVSQFMDLRVEFIPENTMFRINEYDGAEHIEIYRHESYFTS